MKTHLQINDKLIETISNIVKLNYGNFKAFKDLNIKYFFKSKNNLC